VSNKFYFTNRFEITARGIVPGKRGFRDVTNVDSKFLRDGAWITAHPEVVF